MGKRVKERDKNWLEGVIFLHVPGSGNCMVKNPPRTDSPDFG